MTIQHSAITDTEGIHEPKGASTASAGKVYLSDGLGSGTWHTLSRYGELYITGSATTQALTPVAARLDPGTAWTNGAVSGVTQTAADGTMTILETAPYTMHFWVSFNTDAVAAGTLYTFYYAVNGTPSTRSFTVQKISAGVDRITSGVFGIATLTVNDVLSIYAKSSINSTITPVEAGFMIHKL